MLLEMFTRERAATPAADAIVILGPANRLTDKVPAELAADRRVPGPPIFYLKYAANSQARLPLPFSEMHGAHDFMAQLQELGSGATPGDFPDIVQHAAALNGGITFTVHSPAELADALHRIQHRLHPAPTSPAADGDR
jgi:hypothetical protein